MNENNTVTSKENDNSEAISDLIQSIQSKLDNELDTSEVQNAKNNNEKASSYDINKEKDMQSKSESSNINFDLNSIIGLLGKINSNSEDSSFNLGNLDPAIFNKIQKIVVTLGKKDPKKDLLISLKPFLRKSRQDKIGEYITILTVIKAFEVFNDKGSDENE